MSEGAAGGSAGAGAAGGVTAAGSSTMSERGVPLAMLLTMIESRYGEESKTALISTRMKRTTATRWR